MINSESQVLEELQSNKTWREKAERLMEFAREITSHPVEKAVRWFIVLALVFIVMQLETVNASEDTSGEQDIVLIHGLFDTLHDLGLTNTDINTLEGEIVEGNINLLENQVDSEQVAEGSIEVGVVGSVVNNSVYNLRIRDNLGNELGMFMKGDTATLNAVVLSPQTTTPMVTEEARESAELIIEQGALPQEARQLKITYSSDGNTYEGYVSNAVGIEVENIQLMDAGANPFATPPAITNQAANTNEEGDLPFISVGDRTRRPQSRPNSNTPSLDLDPPRPPQDLDPIKPSEVSQASRVNYTALGYGPSMLNENSGGGITLDQVGGGAFNELGQQEARFSGALEILDRPTIVSGQYTIIDNISDDLRDVENGTYNTNVNYSTMIPELPWGIVLPEDAKKLLKNTGVTVPTYRNNEQDPYAYILTQGPLVGIVATQLPEFGGKQSNVSIILSLDGNSEAYITLGNYRDTQMVTLVDSQGNTIKEGSYTLTVGEQPIPGHIVFNLTLDEIYIEGRTISTGNFITTKSAHISQEDGNPNTSVAASDRASFLQSGNRTTEDVINDIQNGQEVQMHQTRANWLVIQV